VSNKHVGNVTIHDINIEKSTFDIGYLVGDKDYWGSNTSSTILLFSLHYAFDNLKLKNFRAGVYSNHLKSRFTLKNIGCVECGRIKNKYSSNDKLVDQVLYCLNKDQWTRIKLKHNLRSF
jgi:RimJ/RimL family protein N-acetyltransferase